MKSYVEILRGLREDSDQSQSDIANLIGTTQQQYSKYEKGESDISHRVLATLADHYNVSVDYIMGRTDCRVGMIGLNKKLDANCTVGVFISDVLSLSAESRKAVLEYVSLQKLKESNAKKKQQ